MKSTIIKLAIAFLCVGATTAEAGQSNQTWLLRVKAKQGTKQSYVMKMNMNMDTSAMPRDPNNKQQLPKNLKIDMTMDYTQVLTKVQGDKYTWEVTIGKPKVNSNAPGAANAMGSMQAQKITMVMNNRGKVLEMKGAGQNPFSSGNMGGVEYPEKPVKVGSTWTSTTTSQGMNLKATYKVMGLSTVGNRTALLIHTTLDAGQMVKSNGPMKVWIDPTTGTLIKSEGKVTTTAMGKMDMSMSLTLK